MKMVMTVTDHKGGCEVLGRCGWCGGRPQLEPQRPLFPPVFCSHSAKFGHSIERPPAAHTSPRELDGHTPFMDGRLRGDTSCNLEPTLGPRIASTNHWGCDTILFSSTSHYVGVPQWDSVYVLGSGGHCSKMSGWRSWKSCWIFLQFYHSSLPLWTRIVLLNFSDQRSNKRKYWNHSAREKHQHEKRKIGIFWWITKSWQIMIQLLQTSTL